MLFKWGIESSGADSNRSNIFYYFFGNYLRSDTDKKVNFGNNERPTVHLHGGELKKFYTLFVKNKR